MNQLAGELGVLDHACASYTQSGICVATVTFATSRTRTTRNRAAPTLGAWIGREGAHHERIATVAAVLTTAAIAAPVASAGNIAVQVKPQISAQVVGAQVANARRAQAAVAIPRRHVQVAQAKLLGDPRAPDSVAPAHDPSEEERATARALSFVVR